jgi:hypothetical protein
MILYFTDMSSLLASAAAAQMGGGMGGMGGGMGGMLFIYTINTSRWGGLGSH